MKLVTFSQPETGPSRRAGVLHCSSVVDPHAVLYSSYGGGDDAARRASAEAPRDMVGFRHRPDFFDRLMECRERGATLYMLDAFQRAEPAVRPSRLEPNAGRLSSGTTISCATND